MVDMKRIMRFIGGLLPALAALGIQIVVSGILMFAYTFMAGIILGIELGYKGITSSEVIESEITKLVQVSPEIIYVFQIIASIVCGIVFFFWYRRITKDDIKVKLNNVFTSQRINLFIVMGFGCQLLISGAMNLIQPLLKDIFNDYSKVMETILSGQIWLVIMYTIILAPIVEELIFRGLILKLTNRAVPFVVANFAQAAIFGIYHGNIVQGIYAFGLGILLGLIARKFKTIIAPIVLHMIVNGSAFLVGFFPPHMIVYIGMTLMGAALVVISYIRLIAKSEDIADNNFSENEIDVDNHFL